MPHVHPKEIHMHTQRETLAMPRIAKMRDSGLAEKCQNKSSTCMLPSPAKHTSIIIGSNIAAAKAAEAEENSRCHFTHIDAGQGDAGGHGQVLDVTACHLPETLLVPAVRKDRSCSE